jgi:chemotaxis protein methyltransferase CheR
MPRKVAKDTPVADAPALRWDLTPPLELLREERFAEALTAMRYLPPEAMDDCDVMLLHAVLLTHNNQLEAANSICRRLIAADDPNAGAYFVLALCCEGSGDSQGAVEHDRTAVYLDGAFAMPHLHLGLLLRRAGDRDAACREFRQAIDLLRREDASRLILFGGGFSRDALSAMCRTEFLACGGQP